MKARDTLKKKTTVLLLRFIRYHVLHENVYKLSKITSRKTNMHYTYYLYKVFNHHNKKL